MERLGIQGPSGEYTDGAVCGRKPSLVNHLQELLPETAEQANLDATEHGCVWGGPERPFRLERVADCANAANRSSTQQWTQNLGKHVGVLMRVDMGNTNTKALESTYLRSGFNFEFYFGNAASCYVYDECSEGGAEGSRGQREFTKGFERQCGLSVDEHDVAAHSEAGVERSDSCGSRGVTGDSHHRCRRKRTHLVEIQNGLIDTIRQTKIVGVYNKSSHRPFNYTGQRIQDRVMRAKYFAAVKITITYSKARDSECVLKSREGG